MRQFTAIIHRGEPGEGGFWATCLEVPGANGQGETKEECLRNLREAIQLMLESEREEAFRLAINLVMYALCLDYKTEQAHIDYILRTRRLPR